VFVRAELHSHDPMMEVFPHWCTQPRRDGVRRDVRDLRPMLVTQYFQTVREYSPEKAAS
jgi:hypothetical protein